MLKKINLLNIILLFYSYNIYSQNEKFVDSLINIINSSKIDSVKAKCFIELAEFSSNSNPDTSLYYANKALVIFKNNNLIKSIGRTYNLIGNNLLQKGDYIKAKENFTKALNEFKSINYQDGIGQSMNSIGLCLDKKGEYDKAIIQYVEALKIMDKTGNLIDKARILNNIGAIYYNVYHNNLRAMEYYEQVLEIVLKLDNKRGISSTYNNLALLYINLDSLDVARKYLFKSIEINKQINNPYEVALSYNNIGTTYSKENNLTMANDYYQKSLEIKILLDDKPGILESYINIGQIYLEQNDFINAKKYFEKSLNLARNIGSKEREKITLDNLSNLYAKMHDYKSAYISHIDFTNLKDSIFNENNAKMMEETEQKYQSEKKQIEIEILQKDKELQDTELQKKQLKIKQQTTQIYAFIAGLILVLFLAIVLYRNYRNKKKANIILEAQKHEISEKNQELNQRNEEISSQRDEIERQRDVVIDQKKLITDSINYASNIQGAILRPISYINQLLPDSFILFKPKDVVGGDFYWYKQVDYRCIIVVADCTGHGVPGAFMTLIGNAGLNQIVALEGIDNPALILKELNVYVKNTLRQNIDNLKADDGMDAGICIVDVPNRNLTYSGAKISLFHFKNNDIQEYKGDKSSLGYRRSDDDFEFKNLEIKIDKNEAFYMTSDGFIDISYGDKKFPLGKKKFKTMLMENVDKPMKKQGETLAEFLTNSNKDEVEQRDDISVFGFKI
ncbi:MAG: hypothetical protein A2046_15815 [Bacteroidetes bacterium GWA2_30_7]|nr:MAG: hypothetical protein A2046_15815 [Bacteroidetes bacterium GWA2_30_7]